MQYYEATHALGFIEAQPKPLEGELSAYYQNKYYQNPSGSYAENYTKEELDYFSNIAVVAQKNAEQFQLTQTLLDIGCGEGFFASAFQKSGWQVSCSDYSEFGLKKHNPELLPYLHVGSIDETLQFFTARQQTFGLVNLQNVLEHVVDPVKLLQCLKALLAPSQSAIRIRVPNDYSDFQLLLVEKELATNSWFNPPEHLSYFNQASLCRLLEQNGYKILSLQADFPIEIFLANPHSNYWKNRSFGKGAHLTRVLVENFLISKNISDYISYSEAAGKLGFGRELIVYAAPI